MRYLLAVLSHGSPESPTAEQAVDSFHRWATPSPSAAVAYHDGPGYAYAPMEHQPWEATAGGEQRGFCAATAALWVRAVREAKRNDCDYVFWLEHDFLIMPPVDAGYGSGLLDLDQLAYVLRVSSGLAQLALMRNAVSREEREAGGLFAHRRQEYKGKLTSRGLGTYESPSETFDWMEHRSYFTTNPSLMRTAFMMDRPFAPAGPECEGRYGLELVKAGYSFGVWGNGEPWCEHIGKRTGFGY